MTHLKESVLDGKASRHSYTYFTWWFYTPVGSFKHSPDQQSSWVQQATSHFNLWSSFVLPARWRFEEFKLIILCIIRCEACKAWGCVFHYSHLHRNTWSTLEILTQKGFHVLCVHSIDVILYRLCFLFHYPKPGVGNPRLASHIRLFHPSAMAPCSICVPPDF